MLPITNVSHRVCMNEDQYYSKTAKLMVVEDNPVVSYLLEQTLVRDGYQVIKASNGIEALDLLAEGTVDLILSDIVMPQMDGGQLCHHIRKSQELKSIPFIILTASDDNCEIARIYRLGIDDYLHKPCQPDLLLAVVRAHIERSRVKQLESEERFNRFSKRIINTLSHEFRTPLMAINAGAEILLSQVERQRLNETKKLLRGIQKGGERLEALVNDFMSLQHIEAGLSARYYQNHRESVPLDRLLMEVRDTVFERYGFEQTAYTFANLAQGKAVLMCGVQIVDALMRLIDNSLKFGPQEGPIEVIFNNREDYILLSVQDRGIGFTSSAPEDSGRKVSHQTISDASVVFGQLNRDILEQQGSGLGLAIVKGVAEIHGGDLFIEHREGGGSVVSIKIPIMKDDVV